MPDTLPTFSVIIPVYNGADKIGACLESLLRQDYPPSAYEIIVVENGSTDNTSEVVERYPVRLVHNSVRGPAAARNRGVAESQADVVAFIDSDCIAEPDWLSQLAVPYTRDDQVIGVGGEIRAFDSGQRNTIERFAEEAAPLINFQGGENEYLPRFSTAHASFPRVLYLQVGGLREDLLTGEDVEFSWRIQTQTGRRLTYAPGAVVYHQHRSTRAGLKRQYRQYGYGEILLDTLFKEFPGYPRDRRFQIRRMLGQAWVLVRYLVSIVWRSLHYPAGRRDRYYLAQPSLRLMIESQNLLGKIEGMIATRWMTDAEHALRRQDVNRTIRQFYGSGQRG